MAASLLESTSELTIRDDCSFRLANPHDLHKPLMLKAENYEVLQHIRAGISAGESLISSIARLARQDWGSFEEMDRVACARGAGVGS